MRPLLAYNGKMLTKREMVNFKKWTLSSFLYTLTIKCDITGAREFILSTCFALFVANNA